MPDIQLVKLSIRRGLEQQRVRVVLEQGELGYTTDTKRVFIGDGILSGGNVVGNVVHTPLDSISARTTLTNVYKNDLIYENSVLWQLSGTDYTKLSSWGNIGPRADETYITFNTSNKLTLSANSLGGDRFAPSAATGGIVATRTNGLSANVDGITVTVSANKLLVPANSLDEVHLKSTTFVRGIVGGNGTKVGMNTDGTQFGYLGGSVLTLSALPASVVTYSTINSSLIGAGLTLDGTTSTIRANLSGVNATLTNSSSVIGLASVTTADTTPLAEVTKDIYGRTTTARTSVAARFSAMDVSSGIYSQISAYNGYPGQVTGGRIPNLPLTVFNIVSANASGSSAVTLALSSAGFMTFPSMTTQDGRVIDRIAVPVFTF